MIYKAIASILISWDIFLFIAKSMAYHHRYMLEEKPYDGAKPRYFVDNIEDPKTLKGIVVDTCKDLPIKK